MGVDAGGKPQEYIGIFILLLSELTQQVDFVEIIHHDAPNSPFQSQLQLLSRLVVAGEIDPVHGETGRTGNGHLARGNHVQPQPLFAEELGQSLVDKSLGRIENGAAGIALAELLLEFGALIAYAELVEDIKRLPNSAANSTLSQPPISKCPLLLISAVEGNRASFDTISSMLAVPSAQVNLACCVMR